MRQLPEKYPNSETIEVQFSRSITIAARRSNYHVNSTHAGVSISARLGTLPLYSYKHIVSIMQSAIQLDNFNISVKLPRYSDFGVMTCVLGNRTTFCVFRRVFLRDNACPLHATQGVNLRKPGNGNSCCKTIRLRGVGGGGRHRTWAAIFFNVKTSRHMAAGGLVCVKTARPRRCS